MASYCRVNTTSDGRFPVQIRLGNCPQIARVAVFRLTKGAPRPVREGDLPVVQPTRLEYNLPAQSVSTLVLSPE